MPDSFDINDPSTFGIKSTGLPSNFSYTVRVNYIPRSGSLLLASQFINVHNEEPLSKEQVLSTAEAYANGTGASGIAGQITSITITEAFRKG